MAREPRILIVDDNPTNVELLKSQLKPYPYILETAYDGEEALERIGKRLPDLVLLDIMMPELDGFETAKQFHSSFPFESIKFIFVTAFGREPSDVQKEIIGKSPFIRKPFEVADLIEVIRSQLS